MISAAGNSCHSARQRDIRDRPPKIVINGQPYTWEEGEAVLFDDSWPHAVINDSDEMRAVLIVDVRRPLPVTADVVNSFVMNVIGRYTYGRAVAGKADGFAKTHFT